MLEHMYRLVKNGHGTITRLVEAVLSVIVGVRADDGSYGHGLQVKSLGRMTYPFLEKLGEFELHAVRLDEKGFAFSTMAIAKDNETYGLGWPKDDKVTFIPANGMTTAQMCDRIGILVDFSNGVMKAGKRISSTVGTPWKACHNMFDDDINVVEHPGWDADVHDGEGRISRKLIGRLVNRPCPPDMEWVEWELDKAMLLNVNRVAVRYMDERGQVKGHLLVDTGTVAIEGEDVEYDILIAPGNWKTELRYLAGGWVGVQPIKFAKSLALDIQSVIYLQGFLGYERLVRWLKDAGDTFMEDIRIGKQDALHDRLESLRSSEDFAVMTDWMVSEYATSGGKFMWFDSMVRRVAGEYLKKLENTLAGNMRIPTPYGCRPYMMADETGGIQVAAGEAFIDPSRSSIFFNRDEYNAIKKILGTADGDDAVCVLPYMADGRRMYLCWRQPNDFGEWVTMIAAEGSWWPETNVETMDESLLPTRMDKRVREWKRLAPAPKPDTGVYSLPAMSKALMQAEINQGALGGIINTMMEEVSNGEDTSCPYPLEEVIDGTIKDGKNLKPVKMVKLAADLRITMKCATSRYMLHRQAYAKLSALVRGNQVPYEVAEEVRKGGREAIVQYLEANFQAIQPDHWLDRLQGAFVEEIERFGVLTDELARRAHPPISLLTAGFEVRDEGKPISVAYGMACYNLLQGDPENFQEEEYPWTEVEWDFVTSEALSMHTGSMNQWAGLVNYVYTRARELKPGQSRDSVLFLRGTYEITLELLRQQGLIGTPVFYDWGNTGYGHAKLEFEVPVSTQGIMLRLNYAWFNWGKAAGQITAELPSKIGVADWSAIGGSSKADVVAHWTKAVQLNAAKLKGIALTNEGNIVKAVKSGKVLGAMPKGDVRFFKPGIVEAAYADKGDIIIVLV